MSLEKFLNEMKECVSREPRTYQIRGHFISCTCNKDIEKLLRIVGVMKDALEFYSGLFGHNDDGVGVSKRARDTLAQAEKIEDET